MQEQKVEVREGGSTPPQPNGSECTAAANIIIIMKRERERENSYDPHWCHATMLLVKLNCLIHLN